MLEAQAGWIAQVARRIADGRASALAVRPEVWAAYDEEMQSRLGSGIWSRCDSWYRDGARITTNWPGQVAEYQRRLANVEWDELDEVSPQRR